jgi:hypothetical protein
MIVTGSAIIAVAGLFVIWRKRQQAMMRRREGKAIRAPVPIA